MEATKVVVRRESDKPGRWGQALGTSSWSWQRLSLQQQADRGAGTLAGTGVAVELQGPQGTVECNPQL